MRVTFPAALPLCIQTAQPPPPSPFSPPPSPSSPPPAVAPVSPPPPPAPPALSESKLSSPPSQHPVTCSISSTVALSLEDTEETVDSLEYLEYLEYLELSLPLDPSLPAWSGRVRNRLEMLGGEAGHLGRTMLAGSS